VTVTSPIADTLLIAGTNAEITWTASDNAGVTSIDLELSRGGPDGPYEPIATGLANTGTYNWLVTAPSTRFAHIRASAHDAAGHTAQDVSDGAFGIGEIAGVGDGPVTAFALSPMSPNPVRGSTRFQFALPSRASVHIGLHDVQGREVQVLADGAFPAGRHAVAWSNAGASRLSPGLYFVRMAVPGRTMVQRLVLTY
jgi:hypothetical protein